MRKLDDILIEISQCLKQDYGDDDKLQEILISDRNDVLQYICERLSNHVPENQIRKIQQEFFQFSKR